jgi:hypothetical protein
VWPGSSRSLSLSGTVELRGVSVRICFSTQPNEFSPPRRRRASIVPLIPDGSSLAIPAAEVALPRKADRKLWIVTPNPGGQPPWRGHDVGSSDARSILHDRNLQVDAVLDLSFAPEESATGRGGVRVAIEGELRFERPLWMRILQREPASEETDSGEEDSAEAVLLDTQTCVTLDRQWALAAVGPNPWISAQLVDVGGHPLCEEHTLGRSMRLP